MPGQPVLCPLHINLMLFGNDNLLLGLDHRSILLPKDRDLGSLQVKVRVSTAHQLLRGDAVEVSDFLIS